MDTPGADDSYLKWMTDKNEENNDEDHEQRGADQEVGVAAPQFDIPAGTFGIDQLFDAVLALLQPLFALSAPFARIESCAVAVGTGAHVLHAPACVAVVVFRLLIGRRGGGEFFGAGGFRARDRCTANLRSTVFAALLAPFLSGWSPGTSGWGAAGPAR